MECECGCGWAGYDDVTQYLIEEALYERLEQVDREVQRRTSGAIAQGSADAIGEQLAGVVPGISPGEAAAAEHAMKMSRLGVSS